jgi:tetratricopeptide (TPR) repeat protein
MSSSAADRERLYELARAEADVRTRGRDWLQRFEPYRADLVEMISAYVDERDARGAEMAAAVWQLWWLGGHMDEGRALLAKVVDAGLETSPDVRYSLLQGLGTIAFRQGDNEAAEQNFTAALEDAETIEPRRHVNALCDLSRVALRRGDFTAVREFARRAYALAERIAGDEGSAARRVPAHMLAAAARMEGDYAEARRYYLESQRISREINSDANVAGEDHNLGYVDFHSGDIKGARQHFRRALEWVAESREMYLLPYCLADSALLALHDHDPERAATLLGAAQAIFDETGAVPDPDDRVEIDSLRAKLQGHEDAAARGRALNLDAALALALDQS